MKIAASMGIALLLAAASAQGAEDESLARMATCRESWLDWQKSDPAQLKKFGDSLRAGFSHKDGDAFIVPKSSASIAGLRVLQVFPDSVGMGVGFSVLVEAPFDKTRAALEKTLGKPLAKCETSDNMRTCASGVADKRTLMLMAEDNPKSTATLVGCYYYYER